MRHRPFHTDRTNNCQNRNITDDAISDIQWLYIPDEISLKRDVNTDVKAQKIYPCRPIISCPIPEFLRKTMHFGTLFLPPQSLRKPMVVYSS